MNGIRCIRKFVEQLIHPETYIVKYLCYDIRGIQNLVFSVPRLKSIVGGSHQIVEFDKKAAALADAVLSHEESTDDKCWLVYSGGGKGGFRCRDEHIEVLASQLKAHAREMGLDLQLGIGDSYWRAAHEGLLFPFIPDSLDGYPCNVSGRLPVGEWSDQAQPHRLIKRREQLSRRAGSEILRRIESQLPTPLADLEPQFFRTVSPEPGEEEELEFHEARCAAAALGSRNRWAIIYMDGNDMGRQFSQLSKLQAKNGWDDLDLAIRCKKMSEALSQTTHLAFDKALVNAITTWFDDADGNLEDFRIPGSDRIVLPFRPLILGGDDIIMIGHCSHALTFVKDVVAEFENASHQLATESKIELWPATGNRLTISAGIVYCKTSFPMHMAIPFAKALLGNAKTRYRCQDAVGKPSPSAVDWESLTDTLVDSPTDRRRRELEFFDPEISSTVRLTRRPYVVGKSGSQGHPSLVDLEQLQQQLANLPGTIRARVLEQLQRPWSERIEFVAALRQRHSNLAELLWEGGASEKRDWQDLTEKGNKPVRVFGVPDALLLLDESRRTEQQTVPT